MSIVPFAKLQCGPGHQEGRVVDEEGSSNVEQCVTHHAANINRDSLFRIGHYKCHELKNTRQKFVLPTRFTPIAVLGRGASGVVASAFDSWTGQVVAIKKVTSAFEEARWARRLLREILLLDFLCHPNLMRLRALPLPPPSSARAAACPAGRSSSNSSSDKSDGAGSAYPYFRSVYLVTDKMDSDLHFVLQTQRLSPDHRRYFLYQLLCGLHYLHSAGIVHRDVKPANILVNRDCRLRLADFGLSRGLPNTAVAAAAAGECGKAEEAEGAGEEGEAEALTEYVVTRHYRAPEIMLVSRAYGTAVDMWAAGCVLAEMLHPGEVLFPGRSYLHMLQLMVRFLGSAHPLPRGMSERATQFMASMPISDGVPLSDYFLDASPLALDLLSKLLVMDPAQRFTAEQALRHPYFAPLFQEVHLTPSASAFHNPYTDASNVAALGIEEIRRIIFRLAMRKRHSTATTTTTAAASARRSKKNDMPAAPAR